LIASSGGGSSGGGGGSGGGEGGMTAVDYVNYLFVCAIVSFRCSCRSCASWFVLVVCAGSWIGPIKTLNFLTKGLTAQN